MPTKRKQPTTPKAPLAGTKRPRGRPPRQAPGQPATKWQDRLLLNPGETLRQAQNISTGNLGQQDVEHYEVIDAQGQAVGTVEYSARTSLTPPFPTRYRLLQKDSAGNVIVEARW